MGRLALANVVTEPTVAEVAVEANVNVVIELPVAAEVINLVNSIQVDKGVSCKLGFCLTCADCQGL
jgi:hypothetical protein